MGEIFEVGKEYEASDPGIDTIIVMKRTDKTVLVKNSTTGTAWRMHIKHDRDGNEILIDSSVPKSWREAFTYSSRWIT